MKNENKYPNLIKKQAIRENEETFSHPWNLHSEITGTHLSQIAGLKRTGVSLVRLASGKESFAYHSHHREEEWIYIISGKGVAYIDGNTYEMSMGDFVAFPTPSVAHNMTNPYDEDLLYLMGGEALEHEIADFPLLDKRMIRSGEEIQIYKLSDGKKFT